MKLKNPANRKFHDHNSIQHNADLIRDEGGRTRSTIWIAALVVIACVILAPFLFVGAPVIAVILGISFMAAFTGSILGKLIARKRERRLWEEIKENSDRIVPIQPRPKNEEAELQR